MNKYAEYPVPAITELLEELCPQGVETVRASEVAEIGTGRSDRQDAIVDGQYPFYVRSETVLRHDSWEFDETAIIIPGEGRVGEIFHYQVGKYALHQRAYRVHIIDNRLNSRFAFHCYNSMFGKFINDKAVNGTVKSLRKPMLMNFEIPLAPLEVQEQIVTVLDTFTDLGTDLNRELALREEQLRHYRRSLIVDTVHTSSASFEEVGRIATVGRGKRVVKKDLSVTREPGMFPVFQNSIAPMGYSNDWNVDGGVAFTIIAGSSSGSIGFSDEPFWAADDCLYFEGHDGVNNRYLYHAFLAYNHKIFHHVTKASMPRLHRRYVETLEIPLPPLEVQEQIVSTLDMFTEYTDNLRREIELRRQQLAYYREQLLTFPVAE